MITSRLIINGQYIILEKNTWSTNMEGLDNSKEDSDE
jgi:hypothetical protein